MTMRFTLVDITNPQTLERLEELRERWHPAGSIEDVIDTLILHSESLLAVIDHKRLEAAARERAGGRVRPVRSPAR